MATARTDERTEQAAEQAADRAATGAAQGAAGREPRYSSPLGADTDAYKCSECGSKKLVTDYDSGEVYCGDCGVVQPDAMLAEGKERRVFSGEDAEKRDRTGAGERYDIHDKGLSTVIDKLNKDRFGRKLSGEAKATMYRLRKWDARSRVHYSDERNLAQAMTELGRLSDTVSAPDAVKERAALIYREMLKSGKVRGRSIAGIAAASLYAACRQTKTPRTLRQIADASTEDKKTVSRCYRVLVKELNINMPTLDPLMYLPKIANRVGAPPAVQTKGEEVLKEANEKRVRWGKDPIGFAAAALYAAGRLLSKDKEKGRIPHTQRDCANAANVTEVTVRNRFKELNLKLNLGL